MDFCLIGRQITLQDVLERSYVKGVIPQECAGAGGMIILDVAANGAQRVLFQE